MNPDKRFELVTICPGFIQGPSISSGDGTSEGFVKGIVTGAMPEVQKIAWPWVDVRTTAEAHLKAVQIDEAKDQRFALVAESLWHKDYAEALAAEFGPKGYKVTTQEAEKGMSVATKYSNERAKKILGIKFIPGVQSGIDMVNDMIQSGKIPSP